MGTLEVDKLDPQSGTALEIGTSGDTATVPSGVTLTVAGTLNPSGTITAGTIAGTAIANDAIDSQHYAAGSIDLEHMSANSVDSDQYVDGSIDEAHIADAAVAVAKLKITGETQLSERPATGDEFVLYDASASANKRINYSNMKTGKILQVVQNTTTTTTTITDSTTLTTITNLSVDITPSATTSKILVHMNCGGMYYGTVNKIQLDMLRDSTTVVSRTRHGYSNTGAIWYPVPLFIHYLDSPSSTSALTYSFKWGFGAGTDVGGQANPSGGTNSAIVIAMEVGV